MKRRGENKYLIIFLVGAILLSSTTVVNPKSLNKINKEHDGRSDTAKQMDSKQIRIGVMEQYGYPHNFFWFFISEDIGYVKVDPDQGTKLTFYCSYSVEAKGDRDDTWGYIDCIIGGAGYDEFKTGTAKDGRLECSKIYKSATTLNFKLYFEYTDDWRATMLKKDTKHSSGFTSPKSKSKEINIEIDILPDQEKKSKEHTNIFDKMSIIKDIFQNNNLEVFKLVESRWKKV